MKRMLGAIFTVLLLVPAVASGQGLTSPWDYTVASIGQDSEFLAIAADGTRAYAAGRINNNFRVDALNGATGAMVWNDDYDKNQQIDEAHAAHVGFERLVVGGAVRSGLNQLAHLRLYTAATGLFACSKTAGNGVQPSQWNAVVQTINRVIAGGYETETVKKWRVKAFDVNCVQKWQAQFAEGSVGAEVKGLAVNSSRLFAVGTTDITDPGFTEWTVRAYNPFDGAVLWTKKTTTAGRNNEARAVAANDTLVYVAGVVRLAGGASRAVIKAYNPATGGLVWEGTDLPAGANNSQYSAIALSTDGTVVVSAGFATEAGDNSWLVTARNALTGAVLWTNTFDTANDEQANAVAIAGNFVIVGGTRGQAVGQTRWRVALFDLAGAFIGSDLVGNATDQSAALAAAGIALPSAAAPLSRFYVAGALGPSATNDGYVKAYLGQALQPVP